jgi:hypothetical protein
VRVLSLFFLRLGLQVLLFIRGFQVLSVDDYLRVSIAHRISQNWQWFPDPLFLPGYFWIYALPLKAGLSVRLGSMAATWFFAALSSALFYAVLIRLKVSQRIAFGLALLWSLQPLTLWLGGVPLSETLSVLLLLSVLLTWDHESSVLRWSGCVALSLLTLIRYESWAIIPILWMAPNRRIRFFERALSVVGVVLFLGWRLLQGDATGPFQYASSEAYQGWEAWGQRHLIFWSFLALLPITAMVSPFALFRNEASDIQVRTKRLMGWYVVSLLLPLFSIGYFQLVFLPRILFFPSTLLLLCAAPALDRVIQRSLSAPSRIFLFVGIGVVMISIAIRPLVDVKPETVEAARNLKLALRVLDPNDHILVEQRDLGWTALWGLNDADPRLVFSNTWSGPLSDRTRCALMSGRGRWFQFEKAIGWNKRWGAGKYRLYCSSEVRDF